MTCPILQGGHKKKDEATGQKYIGLPYST